MDAMLLPNPKYRRRAERAARTRALNEPPLLTRAEEAVNAATHGLGAVLAALGFAALLAKSHTALEITASCFYGVSMILMMLMSGVYHALPAGSGVKRVWRRFDYISIYLLIGGTFAPIFLVYLGNGVGIALFCVQWAVILCGVMMLAVFDPGKWRPLHFTLYFLIGWSGLLFLPEFYRNARAFLWMILAGGLVYTFGMIPFARKGKWNHCVWHVCVLLAAAIHWAAIYCLLY